MTMFEFRVVNNILDNVTHLYKNSKQFSQTTRKYIRSYKLGAISMYQCLYRACSGSTYIKIGTIQRRLAWPLRKDDTQIREAFQILIPLASFLFTFPLFNYFCTSSSYIWFIVTLSLV